MGPLRLGIGKNNTPPRKIHLDAINSPLKKK
jgi:hypothetical protein